MLTYGFSSTTGDISDGLGGSMGMLTENLLKINVYFDSLHQKSVTETKDYDWGVSNPDFKDSYLVNNIFPGILYDECSWWCSLSLSRYFIRNAV